MSSEIEIHRAPYISNVLIFIIIIGILAALVIPRVVNNPKRTIQAEAKKILTQVYLAEEEFKKNNPAGAYWIPESEDRIADKKNIGAFLKIGVLIPPDAKYQYSIEGNETSYRAYAILAYPKPEDGLFRDGWVLDFDGHIKAFVEDIGQ